MTFSNTCGESFHKSNGYEANGTINAILNLKLTARDAHRIYVLLWIKFIHVTEIKQVWMKETTVDEPVGFVLVC
jgi:hypothetical protein